MIQDPTVGLRIAMAAEDLHPGDISWDSAFRRFPGAGKKGNNTSGWYKAYEDRKGAHFGDHSTGLQVHWMADRSSPPTHSMREEWAAEDAKRKKERREQHKRAREQASIAWDNAIKAPAEVLKHPYLKRKEIEGCDRLRISRETKISDNWTLEAGILLVPMMVNEKLASLQRIYKDGSKPFWPGARASGASLIVGGKYYREDATKTIYIAEGWATAWTIMEATKCPVIITFSADGIMPVAKKARKRFATANLIIAADNDRWSKIRRKKGLGDIPNPGVYYAREAAKVVKDCEVAIPDFRDLEYKPTDFDDLRAREGDEAVRYWLDPERAPKAVTTARQPEAKNGTGGTPPPPGEDPLHGLKEELAELASAVAEDGWTEHNCDVLAELRTVARELNVDVPLPPVDTKGKSASEALAVLEAHFKKHGPPEPDPCFEDGAPRGLVHTTEQWSQPPEPRKWVVSPPWGPAGYVVYFTGRGAAGKSHMGMQLAMAIASGKSEMIPVASDDSRAPQVSEQAKGRTVVYVGWEHTIQDALRSRNGITACGGPEPELFEDRLRFVSALDAGFGPLWAPAEDGSRHVATRARPTPRAEQLFAWMRTIPDLALVILDPVASVYASDENSRALVREFLDGLTHFAVSHPAQPMILLIGHPAKAATGEATDYSGVTDWRNAPRALWTLKTRKAPGLKKPGEGETDRYVCLSLDKANFGPHPVHIPLASKVASDGEWRWVEARDISHAVASYAEHLGRTAAGPKGGPTQEKGNKPGEGEKIRQYAEARLEDGEAPDVVPRSDVEEDYRHWHQDTYGEDGKLTTKRTFNRAMADGGRTPRMGMKGSVAIISKCRLRRPEDKSDIP